MRRPAALLCLSLALTGCALSPSSTPSAPIPSLGAPITGNVHGGQQPLVGSHVYLYAANTTGYGGNGLTASTNNASISLLQSAANTTADTNGNYYVSTNTTGSFTITGDYTCTPGQQVYLYAVGGNPTYPSGSNNSAAGFLAALGTCPAADTFPSTTYVYVNEVSTVATAYALAGFATDATHISNSGTTLAQTGITNAFAYVTNLEDLASGSALATTPAGNGTVPQSTINTLANILAACVNTTDPSSTACTTLFISALNGSTQPTDTATAALNIAHNPGSNIANLYGLASSNPPFNNQLATQPNDFTLGINFTGDGLNEPTSIAIDALGNAWIANYGSNSISKFSSSGSAISTSSGYTGGGLNYPEFIAIDGSGDAWTANIDLNSSSKFSSSGSAISPSAGYTGGGLYNPDSIAIDALGNAWIANYSGNSISKFSNSGSAISTSAGYTGGGLSGPESIAIDALGNAWIANYSGNSISKFSSSGSAISTSAGYTGGGLKNPTSIAIDGSGNAWLANWSSNNSISKFSSSGSAISTSAGYTGGGLNNPVSIAIDSSGNAWVVNAGNRTISELIGIATPVVTPVVANLISPYSAPASKP